MRHGHRVGEKLFVEHAGAGPQVARQSQGRNGVRVVEHWILAAPRTALFSLDELNAASAVLLERLNRRRSRGRRPPAPATKAISGLFGITASTCSFEYTRQDGNWLPS